MPSTELEPDVIVKSIGGSIQPSRISLVKDRLAPAAIQETAVREVVGGLDYIEPPYDLAVLASIFDHSNSLRQCVDSYATNIDGFGHRFEPLIDLNSDEADEIVRNVLFMRQQREQLDPAIEDPEAQAKLPSDEEVEACKKELEEQMRCEKSRIQAFFENACVDLSFVTLRMRTRQDKEILGNGYWEVIRDSKGLLDTFNYVPGFTIRLMPVDQCSTPVEMRIKLDELTYGATTVHKRFRRYVQEHENRRVFFKEYGDPRVVSRKSGEYFNSVEELKQRDRYDAPATELLHFAIHSAMSSYGVPRWMGNLLAVLGSRQAEEINYAYFENKSVPPLVFMVSGARLTEETEERIRDHIKSEIKGKKNFHSVLVIEATQMADSTSRVPKIEMRELTRAINNDALFQSYDERNIDKVGMSFRLSRMLRGDVRDFNRATSMSALEFAEMQVFQPERDEFDFMMNRKILPELDIKLWKFKTNSPTTQNPRDLANMVAQLSSAAVLTPSESREITQGIFNRDLTRIDAPWARQPLPITAAGIEPQVRPLEIGELPAGDITPEGIPPVVVPGAEFELTSSDLARVVTVNEARASVGLSPLSLATGEDDPDGQLTIAEFGAKRAKAGEVLGEAEGEGAAAEIPAADATKSDMTLASLEQAGLLTPAQRRRLVRLPPAIIEKVAELLSIREQVSKLELENASSDFLEDSMTDFQSSRITPEEDE